MKKLLTVSVEETLIEKIKTDAKNDGKNTSEFVGNSLAEIVEKRTSETAKIAAKVEEISILQKAYIRYLNGLSRLDGDKFAAVIEDVKEDGQLFVAKTEVKKD